MRMATAITVALMLGSSPAFAGGHGHGGGNGSHGGHNSSASSHAGKASKADQKADRAAAKEARQEAKAQRKAEKAAARAERKAEKTAKKAAAKGFAVETGLWRVTAFMDTLDPLENGVYRSGEFDMSPKGKFTGWTYDGALDKNIAFNGKVNLKSLTVKGVTGDGYRVNGIYTPNPLDVSAAGKQLMAGDLLGEKNVSVGTFSAEGELEQELP
jgi:hypothetical protein